jgi:hypothetical protein
MANAPVLPPAARGVVEEHRALLALLAEVERAFARPSPRETSGPDVVAARLDTLARPARRALRRGGAGRLFEQIEEGAPEQAPACARLRDEHAALIRRLDELRGATPEARRATAWGGEVRRFLADLHGHEERETDLLTRVLDGSIGALD